LVGQVPDCSVAELFGHQVRLLGRQDVELQLVIQRTPEVV
jgi:hypothetical protein